MSALPAMFCSTNAERFTGMWHELISPAYLYDLSSATNIPEEQQFGTNKYPLGGPRVVLIAVELRTTEQLLVNRWKRGKKKGSKAEHYVCTNMFTFQVLQ